MPDFQNIIDCFDKTATAYAEKFCHELEQKPLEKELLDHFLAVAQDSIIDLGCGPGHILQYLQNRGAKDLLGIDLSPAMIQVAQQLNPSIAFEVGNILDLPYPDHTFGAGLAFYSFIYFDYAEISQALQEVKRILKINGILLFSFHLGNGIVHFEEFLGHSIHLDCHFVESAKIQELIAENGFTLLQFLERAPYPNIEFPSRRAYFLVKKN